MTKVLRGAILCPELQFLLIGTDQEALAFLAQIVFTVTVRHAWQRTTQRRCKLRNLWQTFGHKVLVLRRQQRQVQSRQLANLTTP